MHGFQYAVVAVTGDRGQGTGNRGQVIGDRQRRVLRLRNRLSSVVHELPASLCLSPVTRDLSPRPQAGPQKSMWSGCGPTRSSRSMALIVAISPAESSNP